MSGFRIKPWSETCSVERGIVNHKPDQILSALLALIMVFAAVVVPFVTNAETELSFAGTSEIILPLGYSFKMDLQVDSSANVLPEISWASSDSKVVSVNKQGEVKGIREGTAVITATALDGSNAAAAVTVHVRKYDVVIEKYSESFQRFTVLGIFNKIKMEAGTKMIGILQSKNGCVECQEKTNLKDNYVKLRPLMEGEDVVTAEVRRRDGKGTTQTVSFSVCVLPSAAAPAPQTRTDNVLLFDVPWGATMDETRKYIKNTSNYRNVFSEPHKQGNIWIMEVDTPRSLFTCHVEKAVLTYDFPAEASSSTAGMEEARLAGVTYKLSPIPAEKMKEFRTAVLEQYGNETVLKDEGNGTRIYIWDLNQVTLTIRQISVEQSKNVVNYQLSIQQDWKNRAVLPVPRFSAKDMAAPQNTSAPAEWSLQKSTPEVAKTAVSNPGILSDSTVRNLISSCPALSTVTKKTKQFYSSLADYKRDFPNEKEIKSWRITIETGVTAFYDAQDVTTLAYQTRGKASVVLKILKWEISLLEALPGILSHADQYGIAVTAEMRNAGKGDYSSYADSRGVIDLTDAAKREGVLKTMKDSAGFMELIQVFGELGK